MNKTVVQYLYIVAIAGVLLVLASCGQIPMTDRVIDQHEQNSQLEEQKDTVGSVPNFQGIADALGCVFSPSSCK